MKCIRSLFVALLVSLTSVYAYSDKIKTSYEGVKNTEDTVSFRYVIKNIDINTIYDVVLHTDIQGQLKFGDVESGKVSKKFISLVIDRSEEPEDRNWHVSFYDANNNYNDVYVK